MSRYSVVTGGVFPGVKWLEGKTDHSAASRTKVNPCDNDVNLLGGTHSSPLFPSSKSRLEDDRLWSIGGFILTVENRNTKVKPSSSETSCTTHTVLPSKSRVCGDTIGCGTALVWFIQVGSLKLFFLWPNPSDTGVDSAANIHVWVPGISPGG